MVDVMKANHFRKPTAMFRRLIPYLIALPLPIAALAEAENLIRNGDAESGVLPFAVNREHLDVSIFDGNPAGAENNDLQGKSCFKVSLKKDYIERPGSLGFSQIPIDGEQTYRISARVWSQDDVGVSIAGYSYGEGRRTPPLPVPDTKNVWQYSLKKPSREKLNQTTGWSTYETTVGPKGSHAQSQWSKETTLISFGIWIKGSTGATVYFDDFRIEPVERK